MIRRRVAAATMAMLVVLVGATSVALASNDPDFDTFQYGPQQIYAPEAWTVSRGASVTIAVIDTGVQLDHPDLRDKIVPGYDFFDEDNDAADEHGHGTHVAGIAAAVTDNGLGIAGVAPDSKIMPVRVLGPEGSGGGATWILNLQRSIDFAVAGGAQVINLSLGEGDPLGPEGFDRISTACRDAFARGSLCIAAAGNSGKGKPSGYGHDFAGIVVAANDRNGDVADFSQRADTQWSVTAPGVAVYSTWIESGYHITQGTSMAAPHVAGVAALLFAQGLSIQEVVDRILKTATSLNDGGGTSGSGLVNAAAAVGAQFTPVTQAPRPTTTTTAVASVGGSDGGRPALPSGSVDDDDFEIPVDLAEGVIEDDADFVGADTEEGFLTAAGGGLGDAVQPVGVSGGFEASFLTAVALFIGALAVIGVGARRLVLRRGIGEIKT